MVGRVRLRLRRMALAAVMAVGLGTLTLVGSSNADVTAVQGSAFGVVGMVSLFGGPANIRPCSNPPTNTVGCGLTPSVTLPAGGATTPITASAPSTVIQYGPAILFTSDALNVSTQGAPGPNGLVMSSANIVNVNKSTQLPVITGSEVFTADAVSSNCSASETGGQTGSVSFTNATIRTAEGNPDVDGDETFVTIPANPAPGTTYNGVIEGVGDRFRFVVNQQVAASDGSIRVNAAHLYLDGPTAIGELVIAQSFCGVTAVPSSSSTSSSSSSSSSSTSSSTSSSSTSSSSTSTSTSIFSHGSSSTTSVPAGACATLVRATQSQVTSQINAARAAIIQSVPPSYQAALLARLDTARTSANTQIASAFARCPS